MLFNEQITVCLFIDAEAKMAGNSTLTKAKNAKADEFYTQLSDIEKELKNYRSQFLDSTVLCNCDDPFESNFFKFIS